MSSTIASNGNRSDGRRSKSVQCRVRVATKPSDTIRERVDDRHWQLFETRLKQPNVQFDKDYTKSNDYRIIDRLTKNDEPQPPLEPNRRWQTFCTRLTPKSNETDRILSMFQHVWSKNWNVKEQCDTTQHSQTSSVSDTHAFLDRFAANEHDRLVVSTILHQVDAGEEKKTTS